MNPGDIRTFQRGNGNAVVVGVGLWAERQGKWIHIHITGPNGSHTTVTNSPDSERYHRTLFRDLRRTLVKQGCWEFGEEGAETEDKHSASGSAPSILDQRERPLALRYNPIKLRGEGPTASEIVIQDRQRF
jgi:hypothetical protein